MGRVASGWRNEPRADSAGRSPNFPSYAWDPSLGATLAAEAPAVLQRLDAAIRVMDLFRQQNASSGDKTLKLLLRRLVRIRSRFENFDPGAKPEK